MLIDFTGQVVIVSGGGRGIGRGLVERFAAENATVVALDLAFDDAVNELVRTIQCDVTDAASVRAAIDAVESEFGRIDVLVNNAGINPARITAADMTLEYWRKVFAVNVEGPLRASQCVAPIMRDQGGGSIINIGTMAAYSGGPAICAYGASKAALLNLTKSMAQEWAPWKVRVNMVSPGPFPSEMMEGGAKGAPGFKELVAQGTFLKRMAEQWEIVGPILYLASDASSFVTGDDLSVSGGMHK